MNCLSPLLRLATAWALLACLAGSPAVAQVAYENHLISDALTGPNASGSSTAVATSAELGGIDARFVLLHSTAANLDATVSDVNGVQDVYVHDRADGSITLISRSAQVPAKAANGASTAVAISPDGRYVLFNSLATDLTTSTEDTQQSDDAFLHDRQSGQTTWVSRPPLPYVAPFDDSYGTALSADGRVVLLQSSKRLVVGNIDPIHPEVYVYDHDSGLISLVSHVAGDPTNDASGRSVPIALSADGNRVLFTNSGDEILAGMIDGNGGILDATDVFVHERSSQTTRLVSRVAGNPLQSLPVRSTAAGMSADGERVLFTTAADSVGAASDTNGASDVYLFDWQSQSNTLLSHVAGNPAQAGAVVGAVALGFSADGNHALFSSFSQELVTGFVDNNGGADDVYLYRIDSQQATLVSRSMTSPLQGSTGTIDDPEINADGSAIVFRSRANDLVPLPGNSQVSHDQVYVHDSGTGQNTLLTTPFGTATVIARHALPTGISADGGHVLLSTAAADLIPGLVDRGERSVQAYLIEHAIGERSLISLANQTLVPTASGDSHARGMSDDGRWVLFTSTAADLTAAGGIGPPEIGFAERALFLRDRQSGSVIEIPGSRQSGFSSLDAVMTGDAGIVYFSSTAQDVVPGIQTLLDRHQIYRWQRSDGALSLLTPSVSNPGFVSSGDNLVHSISADGRFLLAYSTASDLVAGIDFPVLVNVVLFDTEQSAITVVTRNAAGTTAVGGGLSRDSALSADGRRVLFASDATDIVAGQIDAGFTVDTFLYDHNTGVTALVSGALGSPSQTANGLTKPVALSSDGQRVLLTSTASNLVAGVIDTNDNIDPYWVDLSSGERRLLSVTDGMPSELGTEPRSMSADGNKIVIQSGLSQYLIDLGTNRRVALLDRPMPIFGIDTGWLVGEGFSADGRFLVYSADVLEAQFPDGNFDQADILVYDDERGVTELLSRSVIEPTLSANGNSIAAAISDDGRRILLQSLAADLSTGVADANLAADVYVAELRDAFFADGFE